MGEPAAVLTPCLSIHPPEAARRGTGFPNSFRPDEAEFGMGTSGPRDGVTGSCPFRTPWFPGCRIGRALPRAADGNATLAPGRTAAIRGPRGLHLFLEIRIQEFRRHTLCLHLFSTPSRSKTPSMSRMPENRKRADLPRLPASRV